MEVHVERTFSDIQHHRQERMLSHFSVVRFCLPPSTDIIERTCLNGKFSAETLFLIQHLRLLIGSDSLQQGLGNQSSDSENIGQGSCFALLNPNPSCRSVFEVHTSLDGISVEISIFLPGDYATLFKEGAHVSGCG